MGESTSLANECLSVKPLVKTRTIESSQKKLDEQVGVSLKSGAELLFCPPDKNNILQDRNSLSKCGVTTTYYNIIDRCKYII